MHTEIFSHRVKDAHEHMADLFFDLGCAYHLTPPPESSSSGPSSGSGSGVPTPTHRPEIPGLTPAGFCQYFTTCFLAYPDEEFHRFEKIIADISRRHPDDDGSGSGNGSGVVDMLPRPFIRSLLPARHDPAARKMLTRAFGDLARGLKLASYSPIAAVVVSPLRLAPVTTATRSGALTSSSTSPSAVALHSEKRDVMGAAYSSRRHSVPGATILRTKDGGGSCSSGEDGGKYTRHHHPRGADKDEVRDRHRDNEYYDTQKVVSTRQFNSPQSPREARTPSDKIITPTSTSAADNHHHHGHESDYFNGNHNHHYQHSSRRYHPHHQPQLHHHQHQHQPQRRHSSGLITTPVDPHPSPSERTYTTRPKSNTQVTTPSSGPGTGTGAVSPTTSRSYSISHMPPPHTPLLPHPAPLPPPPPPSSNAANSTAGSPTSIALPPPPVGPFASSSTPTTTRQQFLVGPTQQQSRGAPLAITTQGWHGSSGGGAGSSSSGGGGGGGSSTILEVIDRGPTWDEVLRAQKAVDVGTGGGASHRLRGVRRSDTVPI